MWPVMICNAVLGVAWIVATVYLIAIDHQAWAGACIVGAILSGYTYNTKE